MKSILEICEKCNLPIRTFSDGEALIEEGSPASGSLFILKEGSTEISKERVELNRISSPGSIFGEVSVILDQPHSATVRSIGESTFYFAEDGNHILEKHPELTYYISHLLATRLSFVSSYLVDIRKQYAANDDHLGIVDEVLECLLNHQAKKKSS
ncbi:MAG: 3',5'-cyclic-nucleotide phosphodiesterase [Verrucomicrobiales bacterium]|nr:3',5'-cyclic-nucleotide phosphodiesterase [Verrucomicrobiales bacterium]